MTSTIGEFFQRVRSVLPGQRGITGLETAIVLIAFVVVSSVFAFAALSTGLFTSDKAKDTIHAGLAETRGTMELKGSVILTNATTGTSGTVSDITFQVANAAGGENTNLNQGDTIIKYTDQNQTRNFDDTVNRTFVITPIGTADADDLLERGETIEITLQGLEIGSGQNPLTTNLGINQTFTIEVIPPTGAVLFIERTTPVSFNTIDLLD